MAAKHLCKCGWYSHQELNLNQRFRKPLLYPFELWEQTLAKKVVEKAALVTPVSIPKDLNPILIGFGIWVNLLLVVMQSFLLDI
jgi:hypothetical protein